MNQNPAPSPVQPPASRRDALLLALITFALGIVLAGAWFHHHLRAGSKGAALAPAAKTLLTHLEAPVTIRYYSLLPAGSTDQTLQTFAGRVTRLLDGVQAASGGLVKVTTIDAPSETNAAAAGADGIQAFNFDKGDACYLGLAITSGKARETFARLQPEWEPVLQYDLARAISRVADANKPAPEIAKPSPETVATIKRLIPDVKAVTAKQASQILLAEYLKQSSELATETEAKIQAAQQQVAQAQASGSPTDVEAARKNLLQVQLAQAEKLKQLAAQLDIQQAVVQRMKTGAGNGGN